ncbi:EAL domain-containing protein [Erythrobacter sp. SDW2]|uniref:EAL domain-containing protein n=1 Tax=Erythrobacter sp. SDW2 TaxID=2907154 RepID=UPI001F2B25D5|nr:EAL domain-containing protein [Erythrobacter sp. SDW2]UIP05572.1 EAL domain-containing protein [Erythrobacter sp. SDW2]
MAIAPVVGLIGGALLSGGMPTVLSIFLFALASMMFSAGLMVSNWERAFARDTRTALVAALVVTVVPSMLFGTGFARWVTITHLPIAFGIAGLVSFNALVATMMSGRPQLMYACLVASWAPIALMSGDMRNLGVLGVFTVAMVVLAQYQARKDRERDERRQADERILNRAIDILNDYEETGNGWFWETDRRGLLTYVSAPIAKRLGTRPDRLIGRPITELFDLSHENREGERTIAFHLSARSAFHELAVKAAGNKEDRWWSITGRPIFDSFQNFCGFRGSGTDLTEKKRSQEHASRLAHFDSLTGLANRHQMSQTLEKILTAPNQTHRECAVFLLDLDRFKHVNDTLGHPAGDALLKQVAQRIEVAVGEIGRVGRLGGDEFEVILPGRVPRDRLALVASEIIRSLSQPYSIEGQRVIIGASVGIAISPEHGETSEDVIRNADLALYAAKDGGRGRYHFYSSDLHSAAEARAQMEQDLRDAITEGALELHYQPVVHTATERIAGFEALMRWNHPEHGYISPDRFIPIAEDAGLIQPMGEWALRTACADLAKWPEEVRCAVNVSPLQFANRQLPEIIISAIGEAGIAPSRLELEITESVFLNDDEGTDAMFAALSNIGVRLALDDFGTGYSSLGYLKTAPFNKIKIDQSFVRGATLPGSRNGAIIASITSLAQELGMDTTAEGVETLDELDLVRMHGCSHVQGYIYEKPLTREDATERLRTGLTAIARGPQSARAPRQSMLRKIVLEHNNQHYHGTIRNISSSGALIEGLWNVPPGTIFRIAVTEKLIVTGTTRWSKEDRMGIEFATPLPQSDAGKIDLHVSDTTFALRKAS